MLKYRIQKLLPHAMMVMMLSITSLVHAAHYLIDPYVMPQLGKGMIVDKDFKQWKEFVHISDTAASVKVGFLINPMYTDGYLVSIEGLYNANLHKTSTPWRYASDHHTVAALIKGNFPINENSDYFIGLGLGRGGLAVKGYWLSLFELGYNQHLYNGMYFSITARNTIYFGQNAPHHNLYSPFDTRIYAGLKYYVL